MNLQQQTTQSMSFLQLWHALSPEVEHTTTTKEENDTPDGCKHQNQSKNQQAQPATVFKCSNTQQFHIIASTHHPAQIKLPSIYRTFKLHTTFHNTQQSQTYRTNFFIAFRPLRTQAKHPTLLQPIQQF